MKWRCRCSASARHFCVTSTEVWEGSDWAGAEDVCGEDVCEEGDCEEDDFFMGGKQRRLGDGQRRAHQHGKLHHDTASLDDSRREGARNTAMARIPARIPELSNRAIDNA
jgi:hypothetical protein